MHCAGSIPSQPFGLVAKPGLDVSDQPPHLSASWLTQRLELGFAVPAAARPGTPSHRRASTDGTSSVARRPRSEIRAPRNVTTGITVVRSENLRGQLVTGATILRLRSMSSRAPDGHVSELPIAERRTMRLIFPGESAEYRAARDRLLHQEIELRRTMEALAASRRELPPGGPIPHDYVFQAAATDGAPLDVRLSELFAPDKDSLVIYNFMFPRDPGDDSPGPASGGTALLPLAESPCPSCAALLDQLDGAAEHASQHMGL